VNQDLLLLISIFNQAQLEAVEILESKFNCRRPETTDDYIGRCVQVIREKNYEADGYKIRPHGYGMAVNTGNFKIDFDFGKNGELNGFDPWRLHEFARINKIKTNLETEEMIKLAIEEAVQKSEIYKSSYINYYVNS
jgi:hypothetical protein